MGCGFAQGYQAAFSLQFPKVVAETPSALMPGLTHIEILYETKTHYDSIISSVTSSTSQDLLKLSCVTVSGFICVC